ncbi:hypothetical protein OFR75_15105 [Brachyspira hyodysenteriae]|nr:hypothetical protein [Brachyspira hyodysenteriae]
MSFGIILGFLVGGKTIQSKFENKGEIMIKTLDEAITFYKKKHKLLENYDIEKAEEYKQLADWLIDLKRLKEEEAQYNRWNMIYDNYTKIK